MPIAEIAARLDLSEARVYGLIAKGSIPAVRDGRRVHVPRESFEAWLHARAQRALENIRERPLPLLPDELEKLVSTPTGGTTQ